MQLDRSLLRKSLVPGAVGLLPLLALLMGAGAFYFTIMLAALLLPGVFWRTHVWPICDGWVLMQVAVPQLMLATAGFFHARAGTDTVGRERREVEAIWALRGGSVGAVLCAIAYLASGYIVLYLFQAMLATCAVSAAAGFVAARLAGTCKNGM